MRWFKHIFTVIVVIVSLYSVGRSSYQHPALAHSHESFDKTLTCNKELKN